MASLFDKGDFEEALGKTTGNLSGIVLKTEQRRAKKQLFFRGNLLAVLPTVWSFNCLFLLQKD